MPNTELCINKALEATKGALTSNQIRSMVAEMESISGSRRGERNLIFSEERLLDAADVMSSSFRDDIIISKRNTALAILRKNEILSFVDRFDSPGKGLAAKIAGTDKLIEGGRLSTDAKQQAISSEFLGGLVADMRKENILDVWNSDALEKEIAQELFQIHSKGKSGISGSPEAVKIATVINKWQQVGLKRLNRAGGYIKNLQGYVTRQVHDIDKVRRAGFEKWKEFILPRIDENRTFEGRGRIADRDKLLMKSYQEIITGRTLTKAEPEDDLKWANLGVNVAKKVSASRYLHFKNSKSFMEYNKTFGTGSLRASVHRGIESASRNIALLIDWGPNPQKQFDNILDALESKHFGDLKKTKSFSGLKKSHLKNLFKEVTGEVNIPVSNRLATFSRGIRMMHNMSKLGGVLLSSLVDPAIVSSEFRFQGSKVLASYGKTLTSFISGQGKSKREVSEMIGVGLDGLRGGILARFSNDDMIPGAMSRQMQIFFKMSGLTWYNDGWKRGVGLMMSRDLAKQRGLAWDSLNKRMKNVLSQYEIDKKEWNLIRRATPIKDDGGLEYISPAIVDNLTDKRIIRHLGLDPFEATVPGSYDNRQIRRYRDELSTKIRAYITDRTDYAVLTPSAREEAVTHLGTQPGSYLGEALRFMWQFKTFPLTFATKLFGREFSKGVGSGMLGLSHLIVSTTILGYVARSAKAISKGKRPQDPQDPKTWAQALLQGGALGLYGDFIFGEYNRYGQGVLSSTLGPTATSAEDFFSIYAKAVRGDEIAAKSLRFIVQNTPYANLFYTRAAFDYLIFYQLQEYLNPGYLRRMERRVRDKQGQEFYISPSKF